MAGVLQFTAGNPAALKPIICANLANVDLLVQEKKDGSVPAELLLADDEVIFSMNAAACYLLNVDDSVDVDQWLQWEATQFFPVVHLSVVNSAHKKEDAGVKSALLSCLTKLESAFLGSHQAIHPIFWSTLYPVVVCKLLPDLENSFPKTLKWFSDLSGHPLYAKAVNVVFPKDAPALVKEFLCRQTLPVFVESKSAEPAVAAGPTEEEKKAAVNAWNCVDSRELGQRQHPVLPEQGRRNVLITSALPYVNNVPHLGNIIGCVLSADVFSRFCRLRGYNSLYISGTDEYGTATETKAVQEGMTPEQICHKYNALHSEIYEWFNIDFDFFGRTTTSQQTAIAQDIFWKLYNNGYVLKEAVEQLRCDKCARFLADRFVEGMCPLCGYEDARGDQCDKCGKLINAVELIKPKCKLCTAPPLVKSSDHLFLDLPKLAEPLTQYLQKQYEEGTWTHNAKLITKSWLRDGLKPRCITRDLKWGTPVPLEGFTEKVFYVWFDAPIGYLSITANYTDQWEKWWKNPNQVELYNFMAKDNVPFHSVVFPCSQLGADDNFTIVNHLCATEYLNYEDDKFSKSRGVGVFGNDAQSTGIPADIWRFYLLYVRPESQDSAFSWDDFLLKNNSELLNNLGNFVNRALKFVHDSYGGVIPEMEVTEEDVCLFAQITSELQEYVDRLEKAQLRDGIWHMLTISRLGNQYFQSTTPWKLAKSSDPADKIRAASVVGIAANVACLLSLLIQPYMPSVSQTMMDQLNITSLCKLEKTFTCRLKAGHKIGTPSPLFAKIDSTLVADLKKRFAGTQATRSADTSAPKADPVEAEKLSKQVEEQGSKVRELKSNKAEKSVIDEEVAKLLQLKRQLSLAQGKSEPANKKSANKTTKSSPKENVKPSADPALAAKLTKEVETQGSKVRELKAAKADKSVIDGEVQKLLEFKRQLALAEGRDPNTKPAKSKGKKK